MSSILLAACIVVAMHDADTLTVRCPQRVKQMTVRVAEIDAPEVRAFTWGDQPGRLEALAEAQRLCPVGKPADVRLNKYDSRTKRWIAHVECSGIDLSHALVAEGLAWSYIPDKGSTIPALQRAAQDQRIGLWAPGNTPVAPNIWRKQGMH